MLINGPSIFAYENGHYILGSLEEVKRGMTNSVSPNPWLSAPIYHIKRLDNLQSVSVRIWYDTMNKKMFDILKRQTMQIEQTFGIGSFFSLRVNIRLRRRTSFCGQIEHTSIGWIFQTKLLLKLVFLKNCTVLEVCDEAFAEP